MSNDLIRVQVASPIETSISIGVLVKVGFDESGKYNRATDLQWFPKKLCSIEKIEPNNETKEVATYFLTAPKWLIDKKIKK